MYQNTIRKGVESTNAIISSGAFVHVDVDTFLEILSKEDHPILVKSYYSFFLGKKYLYMTTYRNLFFYTESKEPIIIPDDLDLEIIVAERMWIPKL